jgi:D-amino peptidase
VKVFVSSDIEGAAGVVDWAQVLGPGPEYELGRRLLLDEVNAAIDGACSGGASAVVVNDSHWTMQNLSPGELHGEAEYLSGKHKPLYMMEGLDGTFGAAFFVAYHGAIDAERAVLSHTYNPACIHGVRVNGMRAGESGLNALVALAHGVPVALVTGDEATAEEARAFMPEVEAVVVKRSISRFAAQSLHPARACELIRDGARRALERAPGMRPPAIELPATIEIDMRTADMAEMATLVRGVERAGTRSVVMMDADPLALYRTFVTVVALTRGLGEG